MPMKEIMRNTLRFALVAGVLITTVCAPDLPPGPEPGEDAGISLPAGFAATVFAPAVGRARHVAVRGNGDVFVALRAPEEGMGIVALRDTDGDGKADVMERFGEVAGTGIAFYGDYLYFGADDRIVRFPMHPDQLLPAGPMELVARVREEGQHAAKPIAFDGAGNLYVNVGAPSNGCQERDRTPGSPGMDPCPLLEHYGGIWRFDADRTNQSQDADGYRHATGLRNCVAMAWNPAVDALYAVQHGRDQLNTLFPALFSDEDNAELPAEEFHKLHDGSDCGWPYTYWDGRQGRRVVAPEYGGDGAREPEAGRYQEPIAVFPAHWAPNGLVFYTGAMFPERYRGGAFIAWHGSWNRAPLEQRGYKVTFTPMDAQGMPAGDFEVFADGFAGIDPVPAPGQAAHRPMGLAVAPDGALFIVDSQEGRVWRVVYQGVR